jgi:hypothetical protein
MTHQKIICAATATCALLAPRLGHAQPISVTAPVLEVGDSWVFDRTEDRGNERLSHRRVSLRVDRIDENVMLIGARSTGAPAPAQGYRVGLDWTQTRVIDGQPAVTGRPFKFPMARGDSWTVEFRQAELHDGQTNTHWRVTYEVTGWKDVTTPAGTFQALQIKETGSTEAEWSIPQLAATPVFGAHKTTTKPRGAKRALRQIVRNTMYGEFYYVPSIKYYVKYFQEQYNADNLRTGRDEDVLVSFKTGGSTQP